MARPLWLLCRQVKDDEKAATDTTWLASAFGREATKRRISSGAVVGYCPTRVSQLTVRFGYVVEHKSGLGYL